MNLVNLFGFKLWMITICLKDILPRPELIAEFYLFAHALSLVTLDIVLVLDVFYFWIQIRKTLRADAMSLHMYGAIIEIVDIVAR